jgi:hypothetical protein
MVELFMEAAVRRFGADNRGMRFTRKQFLLGMRKPIGRSENRDFNSLEDAAYDIGKGKNGSETVGSKGYSELMELILRNAEAFAKHDS